MHPEPPRRRGAMLSQLLRAYVIGRLLRRRHPPRRGISRYGYGRGRRGRTGMYGPFPYYSTRTRGGSRVTVSGCCLPIPLVLVSAVAWGVRAFLAR